jgi:hypothetical protein
MQHDLDRQLFQRALENIRRRAERDYWLGVLAVGLVSAVASVPVLICAVWWVQTLP